MSTAKKTAAKTARQPSVELLPPITVSDLEGKLSETVRLIEALENLAPAGILRQHCQMAKVVAGHAVELLEALKP